MYALPKWGDSSERSPRENQQTPWRLIVQRPRHNTVRHNTVSKIWLKSLNSRLKMKEILYFCIQTFINGNIDLRKLDADMSSCTLNKKKIWWQRWWFRGFQPFETPKQWNGYNPELPVGRSAGIDVVVKHLLRCYRWRRLTLNAIGRKFRVVSARKGKTCYSNKPKRNGTPKGQTRTTQTHKQGQLIWQVAQTNHLVWTTQTTQPREKWRRVEEEGLEKELNYHTDNSMPIRYC